MRESLAVRLEGRFVTLEPLGEEHVDGLRRAAADERIWEWMIGPREVSLMTMAMMTQSGKVTRMASSATPTLSARRSRASRTVILASVDPASTMRR